LKKKLCGYIDFCFARMDLNLRKELFEELAYKIGVFGQTRPQPQFVKVSMELSKASYGPLLTHSIHDPAYCFTIWIGGFGATERDAFDAYSTMMAILAEFFEKGAWQ
jgi:hypothetical protein